MMIEPVQDGKVTPGSNLPGLGVTILIVDDEPGVTRLCERVLQKAGYATCSAGTSQAGLELLTSGGHPGLGMDTRRADYKTYGFDLLLVDLRMPGMDGFQMMDVARQLQPDLAVVAMTGFGTLETAIEALRRGTDGIILKPFSATELVESVQQALEASRHKQDVLRLQALRPLFNISERLFSETDPDRLQHLLLEVVCGYLQCTFAALYAADNEAAISDQEYPVQPPGKVLNLEAVDWYAPSAVSGARPQLSETDLEKRAQSLAELVSTLCTSDVIQQRTILAIPSSYVNGFQGKEQDPEDSSWQSRGWEIGEDNQRREKLHQRFGLSSMLCAPLTPQAMGLPITGTRDRREEPGMAIQGSPHARSGVAPNARVLLATRQEGEPAFREADLEMFAILIRQAAVALENARLHAALRAYLRQVETSQRALIQAEKMATAGRMTASIAHEINNPLQSVENCLHLASRADIQAVDRESYLELARGELVRLQKTVQRMLDFYRPTGLDRKPVNLHALIQKVLALTDKQLRDGNIQIHLNLAKAEALVLAVEDQLQQVLLNLILNAAEAMPSGGEVWIETTIRKERQGRGFPQRQAQRGGARQGRDRTTRSERTVSPTIEITIRDNGPGISPEQQKTLFDPGDRGLGAVNDEPGSGRTGSSKKGGTGLGLTVSYGIIAAHGGNLEFVETPEPGACFRITLYATPRIEEGIDEPPE